MDAVEPRYTADGELIADGRLAVDPAVGPLVTEAFKKRAAGESVNGIATWLQSKGVKITTSGLRKVLANRAYLGESTHQTKKKGEVRVLQGMHNLLTTPEMFESAQASCGRYEPRTGIISEKTHLLGIARCASCGQNLHGSASGRPGNRRAYYACTGPKPCEHRASVSADALNEHVWLLLSEAVADGHEGVTAIIDGGDSHVAALQAIDDAEEDLAHFIEHNTVRELGEERWARVKASKQSAVDLARKELRNHKPEREDSVLPGEMFGVKLVDGRVVTTVEERVMREAMRLLVRRVDVGPSTRVGVRPSVADRTKVVLAGDGGLDSGGVVVTSRVR
jgi:hypothetical protein